MNATGDPIEPPDRRVTWAGRENARRRAAYETARERWRELDDALREMVQTASGIRTVHPDDPPPVSLRHGEIILWASPNVRLVEPKANLPLGEVGHRSLDLDTLSVDTYGSGDATRDEGGTIVTNQRVIFRGGHSGREWAYARLTGITHETARTATLMRIDNRKWASGLLVTAADVPGFRFAVTLGLADHLGRRPELISHLEDMLAAHRAAEPAEPEPVRPEDAPAGVLPMLRDALHRVSPRLLLATGAGALSLAVVLGLLGALGGLSSGPQTSSGASGPSRAGAAPAPATGLYGATGSPGGRTLSPPPTSPSPSATPTPSPSRSKRTPKAPRLCGAPDNPYGYNFCGGSVVTDPRSDTCRYFSCESLSGGKGYLVQCSDGTMSLSGGRPNACAPHDGVANTVYR